MPAFGALKDTFLSNVDTNLGSLTEVRVRHYPFVSGWNVTLVSFDVSSLAGITVALATLRLAFFSSSAEGNTHWAYKLLHNDWVEDEAKFSIKKASTPWNSGNFSSSDWVTSNPAGASAIVPSLIPPPQPAVEWDVTAIVQDALDNIINTNMAVMGVSPEQGRVRYDSKEATASADRPKLTVLWNPTVTTDPATAIR